MGLLNERRYYFDFALVIDSSGDMAPHMPQIKEFARTLYEKVSAICIYLGRCSCAEELRIRVRLIDFADYETEGSEAIRQTRFFELPAEREAFEAALEAIDTGHRGGDAPENGLEALYAAMMSDWTQEKYYRKLHNIVLFSNAYPLDLHERAKFAAYPKDEIPSTLEELEAIWNEHDWQEKSTLLSEKEKRLYLVVPEGKDILGHTWENVAGWAYTNFIPHCYDEPDDALAGMVLETIGYDIRGD